MSRLSLITFTCIVAVGAFSWAASPGDDGCIDRGYGEPTYCPPRPTAATSPAADAGACVEGGMGEAAASYCPLPSAPAAPAPAPESRCIDGGYGDSTYCSVR